MKTVLLFSQLAFYPIHWQAYAHLCANFQVQGKVIANAAPSLPAVHQQLGWQDPLDAQREGYDVRFMPAAGFRRQVWWLYRQLHAIRPDAIWVQEEPTDPWLALILLYYRFNRSPRIVTAVCENIFSRREGWQGGLQRWLWARLDGLLGVAQPSIDGIRQAGMPGNVPAYHLVAGALSPPGQAEAFDLPFVPASDDFVVGFVGRICEQKGWQYLLAAVEALLPRFKCVLVGDGEQAGELRDWLEKPSLKGRAFFLGLMPKQRLWAFYRTLDCLVLPSVKVPGWEEQFGGVLADGMALGIPLVGTSSGSIPDVIGPAGLVVPERDAAALRQAVQTLANDPALRAELSEAGKRRFQAEFAIPAYAAKIARALQLEPRQ